MAEPTITLTKAKGSTEAKKAIGALLHAADAEATGDATAAEAADVDQWLVRQLRSVVLANALDGLNAADEAKRREELAKAGW